MTRLSKPQRAALKEFSRAGIEYVLEERKRHLVVFVGGEHVFTLHRGGKADPRELKAAGVCVRRILSGRQGHRNAR